MLKGLIQATNKKGMKLAPFIGIGCPGIIGEDGSIERGAQNLPGNWEGSKFNLPVSLLYLIPKIGDEEASIVMHNDAKYEGHRALGGAYDRHRPWQCPLHESQTNRRI